MYLFLTFSATDVSKFAVTAVVRCTSMVKSIPENHYKLDALTAQKGLMCRALAQPVKESRAYTVSAELLNRAGWSGVHSGHLGLLFNAVDENTFDFVYFRCRSFATCNDRCVASFLGGDGRVEKMSARMHSSWVGRFFSLTVMSTCTVSERGTRYS